MTNTIADRRGRKDRDRYIRRVTWIGLLTNLLLTAIKFTAGFVSRSQVLVADAVHSLSDSITDVAVIVGSYYWSRQPDEDHPYGHQRIETLVTLFIGSLLLVAGAGIGWRGIASLHHPRTSQPGWLALGAAALSVVVKEVLYRWTAWAGCKVGSTAVTANAWHHRLDAISSVPALAAISGGMLYPRWIFLDPIGAVIVALLIVQAAAKIIWPGISEILDTAAPREACELIRSIAHQNPAVIQVHRIRTRQVGNRLQIDLHLVVDGALSVRAGHAIAKKVRQRILSEGPDVMEVVIHMEPTEASLPLSEMDTFR